MPRRNSLRSSRQSSVQHTVSGRRTRVNPSRGIISYVERSEWLLRKHLSAVTLTNLDARDMLHAVLCGVPYGTRSRILGCTCQSRVQDSEFGNGKRQHVLYKTHYVCTICGRRK